MRTHARRSGRCRTTPRAAKVDRLAGRHPVRVFELHASVQQEQASARGARPFDKRRPRLGAIGVPAGSTRATEPDRASQDEA
jgi:hypothetical protein